MSAAASSSGQKTRHTADLVVLVSYFFLHPSKYTKCTGYCRTFQFRPLQDFMLFVGDTLLHPNALIEWFQMSPRLSSPWKTRRTTSKVRPSLTSDQSARQPSQFEQAPTSSSSCENMDVTRPPQSVTTLPLRVSARSAPQTSSPSSGRSASKWAGSDLDSPQKTLAHTLSALAEPWPCTSQGSQTEPSLPSDGGAR